MKKTFTSALLGCVVLASASFANINLNHFNLNAIATNALAATSSPSHTLRINYPGHDSVVLSDVTISAGLFTNGVCGTTLNSQDLGGGTVLTNQTLTLVTADDMPTDLGQSICFTMAITDKFGTQKDRFVAIWGKQSKKITEFRPAHTVINLP